MRVETPRLGGGRPCNYNEGAQLFPQDGAVIARTRLFAAIVLIIPPKINLCNGSNSFQYMIPNSSNGTKRATRSIPI